MNHSNINISLLTQCIRLLWRTKKIELMEVPSTEFSHKRSCKGQICPKKIIIFYHYLLITSISYANCTAAVLQISTWKQLPYFYGCILVDKAVFSHGQEKKIVLSVLHKQGTKEKRCERTCLKSNIRWLQQDLKKIPLALILRQ